MLKDKEGIEIGQETKIYGKKRTRLRIIYNNRVLFEIVEIRNKFTYYLVINNVAGKKIIVRDDKRRIIRIVRRTIRSFERALSEAFDREFAFVRMYEGKMVFTDEGEFFTETEDEEYKEEKSSFNFKGYIIPVTVYLGVNSGRMYVAVDSIYFINEFMNKLKEYYNLSSYSSSSSSSS